MAPVLVWLILFLCLLISIFKYTLALILKWSVPRATVKKDYTYQPTVSVLMPCFNEGKTVYETIESISKSIYPNDKFEVIAQDDCSVDDSYEWMLKAQRDFANIRVRVGRNTVNSGKARTVCNALQHSTAELMISIDSDCIFHPDAIRELTACFSEPKIGSVGGRVGVRNPNENAITAIQTFIYYAAFQLYKVPENWTRSVGCISGCLFAIRRELLLEIEPKIRSRHWFGIPVNQGEDRFLTHQTLLRGYGTYINNDALCWTTVPATLPELFKQQLRWKRSIVRDLFYTLRTLPQHVWTLHPNTVLTLVLTPLGALLGLLVVAYHALRESHGVGRSGAIDWISRDCGDSQFGDQKIQRSRSGQQPARLRRLFGLDGRQQFIPYHAGTLHPGFQGLGYARQRTGGHRW